MDISPQRGSAVLELLGFAAPEHGEAAVTLSRHVKKKRSRGKVAWTVGAPLVQSPTKPGEAGFVAALRCDCRGMGTKNCAHIGAVLLAVNEADPGVWKSLLHRSRAMKPTAPGSAAPRPSRPPARRRIAYELAAVQPPSALLADDALAYIKAILQRRPLTAGDPDAEGELGPPARSLAELERSCLLVPLDRQIDGTMERIRLAAEAPRAHLKAGSMAFVRTQPGGSPEAADSIFRRLFDDLLTQLTAAPNLRYAGLELRGTGMPLPVRLRLEPSGADSVRLALDPPLLAGFVGRRDWVITGDLRLAPLQGALAPGGLQRLLQCRGTIPRDAVQATLRDLLRLAPIPVDSDPSIVAPPVEADTLEPVLHLAEADGALRLDGLLAYRVGAVRGLPSVLDPSSELLLSGPNGAVLRVVRDVDLEQQARAQLAGILERPLPCKLRGDEALDFLQDDLPKLALKVGLEGQETLSELTVLGELRPNAETDGEGSALKLKMEFAIGDETLAPKKAIRAWAEGERWLKLKSGWARLPGDWMRRHSAALEELEEIRRGRTERLPLYGLPLAAPILADRGGDETPLPPAVDELLDRLRRFDRLPQHDAPDTLKAVLRGYQTAGFRWLTLLEGLGLGACLADEMGLGKTVQVLALLLQAHARPGGAPSIVVAPTSVLPHWDLEMARFAPSLTRRYHHGGDRDSLDAFGDVDVVLTTYGTLRRDRENFLSRPFKWAILDEAQAIKNPDSRTSRIARSLRAEHRLAVTGTPLENDPLELWSLFEFLMPGFFGSKAGFDRRYAAPLRKTGDSAVLGRLRARTRPFILRRHKREVASELPPLQERVVWCPLGKAQRELYETVRESFREPVLSRIEEEGIGPATLHVLEALLRLRQACCDPGLLPFEEAQAVQESSKRTVLREMLTEASASGHRSLVFSQWPSMLKRVVGDLDAAGLKYLFLDGTTRNRAELVERWNDPEGPPVFLISLKAGGSGLNLQAADHVFHLDPWWNPAIEAQATARAHRIGQHRPVMVFRLVARETVEERMLEIQACKRALFEGTIEEDRVRLEQLTKADLAALLEPLQVSEDDFESPPTVDEPLVPRW